MKNFNALVNNITSDLRAWSLYLTKNPEEAKDLYQDCMIKIYTHSHQFKENSNIKAWSLTIMRNLFLNQVKKQNKMRTNDISEHSHLVDQSQPNPLQQLFYQEITQEIKRLPKTLSETFSLFTQGYKYHEIADELQVPIGTVKSRINTTRKMLQATLN